MLLKEQEVIWHKISHKASDGNKAVMHPLTKTNRQGGWSVLLMDTMTEAVRAGIESATQHPVVSGAVKDPKTDKTG